MTLFWHQCSEENESVPDSIFAVRSVFLGYIFLTMYCVLSNRDSMPKLGPREIDVPIYPDGAHILAFHLLGLDFWMFRVFHCFSIIYRPLSLIVTQIS
jgi:hypothetical protein